MYQLNAFMVINDLIDNTLNTTSVLGELSQNSYSFTREVGYYTNDKYKEVRLITFYSFEDKVKTPLTQALADELLKLGNWLAEQSTSSAINDNRGAFVQMLTANYREKLNITNVGKMVSNGTYWLPEYITFSLIADTRENEYRIWFSDAAFQTQYDKFEIEVVAPFVNVDDFHKGADYVKSYLTNRKGSIVPELHNRINKKANEKPYTYLVSYQYGYINPDDKTDITPTVWTAIVYGEHGNNIDVIRQAFEDYALANSTYSQPDWERILPDLFIPTEFYIVPYWKQFATENKQVKGGIYSPVVSYAKMVEWAKESMYGYEEAHIQKNLSTFGTIYKSMAVLACGNARNRLVSAKFEEAWPEYCNIYTTSRDFGRISPDAQEFIMVLCALLLEAETTTQESPVPKDMSRIKRGEKYYLARNLNGVSYLVPIRWNWNAEISVERPSVITIPVVNNTGSTTVGDQLSTSAVNITPSVNNVPNTTGTPPTGNTATTPTPASTASTPRTSAPATSTTTAASTSNARSSV